MANDLHKGHRERMRRRFRNDKRSFDNFNEHEVLEMLLYITIKRRNTNEIAHELINKFGSLRGVLNASESELKTIKFIGDESAEFLVVLGEFMNVAKKQSQPKLDFENDRELLKYYIRKSFGDSEEGIGLICTRLDNSVFTCGKKGADLSDEDLRALFDEAAANGAAKIISAHVISEGGIDNKSELLLCERMRNISDYFMPEYGDHCACFKKLMRVFQNPNR